MLITDLFSRIKPEIKSILLNVLENDEELSSAHALKLLKVTGNEFIALQYVANQLCYEKHNNVVTFVINRNINFTDVCFQGCKFCCFSVPDKNKGFLLDTFKIIS